MGTVFELAAGSTSITVLASFNPQVVGNAAGLALDANGDLYGTAARSGQGILFEVVKGSGTITALFNSDPLTHFTVTGPLVSVNGNIYGIGGITGSPEEVFELDPDSSILNTLASLGYSEAGIALAIGSNPNLIYVTTQDSLVELALLPFGGAINGTAAVDHITLVQDPDHHNIDWTLNGGPTYVLPINDPNGLTINGIGGNDVISLDYSNGNPLPAILHLNGTSTIDGLQGANPLVGRTLDIGTSTVYISYADIADDPIFAIRAYLQAGHNSGPADIPWSGSPTALAGIITSATAENDPTHATAIGYADSSDGQGINPIPNTIELKYTLTGDTNLDGMVNTFDLQRLLFSFNTPGGWDQGDFNYDGQVDTTDLQALLRAFNASLANPAVLTAAATNAGAAVRSSQADNAAKLTRAAPLGIEVAPAAQSSVQLTHRSARPRRT
jgi:hypothetical protein